MESNWEPRWYWPRVFSSSERLGQSITLTRALAWSVWLRLLVVLNGRRGPLRCCGLRPRRRLRRAPLPVLASAASEIMILLFKACESVRRSAAGPARLLGPSGTAAFGRIGASGASRRGLRPRPHCGTARCSRIRLHLPARTTVPRAMPPSGCGLHVKLQNNFKAPAHEALQSV